MKPLAIGIDPGVSTGFAVKDIESRRFIAVETLKIHQAMERIKDLAARHQVYVIVEDARKRKWFGNKGREALQGAGSVKRDSSIWEDFLTDLNITHRMQAPKATKIEKEYFKKITYWEGRTSIHAREAAMFILPVTPNTLPMYFKKIEL